MSWTTPEAIRAQLQRHWTRGELLRRVLEPDPQPLRLALKAPSSAELGQRFAEARQWVATLDALAHLRIEWRTLHHRALGPQRLPARLWVDDTEAACALIGKRGAVSTFRCLVVETEQRCPGLRPWLARRPLRALELAEHWSALLAVTAWCLAHPRPGIYLRQVDIPGVHTKFIETHRAVLAEWLDLLLPATAIDSAYSGAQQFAPRYGFRDKPVRIRFRVLDPELLPGAPDCPDITLDAASFAALALPLRRVFITENETNFLAFPPVAGAIVIFGAGYGWEALAQAQWLQHCALHYWGDIDTHGFAILDRLRAHLPGVESLLMDRATLLAHRDHWGHEPQPFTQPLSRLDADERALFEDLVEQRLGKRLRLEQERVGFSWLEQALTALS
ncbi:Wadjet anti-phage system protein JetD domain-containing protein [Marichromatium bheemlicum]|uniref:Wadjet protein JetD C-terminal domain-containing protein n=1 Tax=Marichromatium bheemlicum TaxID=365339 RepID=A0ABX1I6L0_9GAMM|nr:Wadjet anti-phage system protein JetD domain-containing protein [Marichromatium bheemlicum]NKN32035.1 hypothetical protein [Marichromatium bheemlicum]